MESNQEANSVGDVINDGGAAFPMQGMHVKFGDGWIPGQCGMSLRDWFAGQALAQPECSGFSKPSEIAEAAYNIADAMIAAREVKP